MNGPPSEARDLRSPAPQGDGERSGNCGAEPQWPQELRPREPTEVGGRHMSEPTGPVRDSSLQDRKAPGVLTPSHLTAPPTQSSGSRPLPPPQRRQSAPGLDTAP